MTWTELKDRGPETGPFLERDDFHLRYSGYVDLLGEVERGLGCNLTNQEKDRAGRDLLMKTAEAMGGIAAPEAELFAMTWQLFTLRHGLFPQSPEVTEQILTGGKRDYLIESLGAPGSGKTVEAKHLIDDLGGAVVRLLPEPVSHNPFLGNPDAVLRSQLLYLLGHLKMVVFDSLHPGIAVSDTSFAYNRSFMDLRYGNREVTEGEYQTYCQAVDLLSRLIPQPDVILHLHPTAANLRLGILERLAANQHEPGRAYERDLSLAQLQEMIDLNVGVVENLRDQGNLVLTVPVDPRELYAQTSLRYQTVYDVRLALDLFDDLLEPLPQEVVMMTLDYLLNKTGQIVGVVSSTMFTAKSKVMLLLKEKFQSRMQLFQPAAVLDSAQNGRRAAIRGQMLHQSMTVDSNGFGEILALLEQCQITPEETPVIGIDEFMLFLANQGDPEAAISLLRQLSDRGFNVVLAGVTRTYKGQPFYYMEAVMDWIRTQANGHLIEVSTRCKYCGRRAEGTRLTDSVGNLANRDGSDYVPGGNFEPVCLREHPSCV